MGSNENSDPLQTPPLLAVERVLRAIKVAESANVDGIVYVLPESAGEGAVYTRQQVEAFGKNLPLGCRATTPGKLLAYLLIHEANFSPDDIKQARVRLLTRNHSQLTMGAGGIPSDAVHTLIARFGHGDRKIIKAMEQLFETDTAIRYGDLIGRNGRIQRFELEQRQARKASEKQDLIEPVEPASTASATKPTVLSNWRRISTEVKVWHEDTLAQQLGAMKTVIPDCIALLGWKEKECTAQLKQVNAKAWKTLKSTDPDLIAQNLLRPISALEAQHDLLAAFARVFEKKLTTIAQQEIISPELKEKIAQIDAVYQQLHLKLGLELFGGGLPKGSTRPLIGRKTTPDSWSRG